MRTKWEVTPVELFFLGVQMNAKYIDYQYIAMMPDVQKNYSFHEQKTLERLEEKGILEEDFSGIVEIEEEIKELLLPVFFGETESRIQTEQKSFHVHLYQGEMTLAWIESGNICFRKIVESDLSKILTGNLSVQSSKAGIGVREGTYTAYQIAESITQKKAMRIIKGEW